MSDKELAENWIVWQQACDAMQAEMLKALRDAFAKNAVITQSEMITILEDVHHPKQEKWEAAHWKGKFEHTVKLCRAIWNEYDSVFGIKYALSIDDDLGASELWNELDYPVQKLLITAPLYGGPFTTKERAKIKELWEISVEDIEA